MSNRGGIVEAVDDFVQNPKNKAKLKDVAEVAGQTFPNNTRDFSTTTNLIRKNFYLQK